MIPELVLLLDKYRHPEVVEPINLMIGDSAMETNPTETPEGASRNLLPRLSEDKIYRNSGQDHTGRRSDRHWS